MKPVARLTPALQLSVRAAFAAGLAVAIAELLRFQQPLYAMIGAVIVSDLSPAQTRQQGFGRLAGSALGALVGASVSSFLPSTAWSIALSVLVAMFLSHLLRLPGAAKLTGYVSGIVVLGHGDHPWFYGFYRLIETMVGIAMAIAVSFVPKLLHFDNSRQQGS